jgi:hypothetical protein
MPQPTLAGDTMTSEEAHNIAEEVLRFVRRIGAPVVIDYERNGPNVEVIASWDDTNDEIARMKIGPID